jgi:hypothetical protein
MQAALVTTTTSTERRTMTGRVWHDRAVRFACVALVVAIARAASADPAAADKLASEASSLATAGKLAEAAAAFRAAYAEDPRPQLVCNAGVAYYKASDLPRAAYYLEQCRAVGGQLDPAFLDSVDKVLAAVRQVLSTGNFAPLTISSEPKTAEMTIENSPFDAPIVGQHSVWLPFGSYTVHVHQIGYDDRDESIHPSDRTPITLHIQLSPHEEPKRSPPPEPVHVAPAPVHVTPATPSHSRVPAIAVTAGTVVLGVLAGISYAHALDLNDQAARTHDYTAYQDLRSSTLSYEHLSWAAAGLAGAGAVASGLLWYRGMHVEAAPDRVVAALGGTF